VLPAPVIGAAMTATQDRATRIRQHALDLGPGAAVVVTPLGGQPIHTVIREVRDDRIVFDDPLDSNRRTEYTLSQIRAITFAQTEYNAAGPPDVDSVRRLAVAAGLGGRVEVVTGGRTIKGSVQAIGAESFSVRRAESAAVLDVLYSEVTQIRAGTGARLHPAVASIVGVGAGVGAVVLYLFLRQFNQD
jgi:hypothetical protein